MQIFVASFNRASNGAISKLIEKLKKNNMYTTDHNNANYILAVGDRIETYDFVLKKFKENKKIIHLWAGDISNWELHDDAYRHSMTLMSMMQLCTNPRAKKRVELLCKSVNKKSNAYVIGNVMLDDLSVDESIVPKKPYLLILYNPVTIYTEKEVILEIDIIKKILNKKKMKYIWIEPNGDKYSSIVYKYVNQKNLPRNQFLALLKNCTMFITNSSCQYYEAPSFLKHEQIMSIGERNIDRESKYADMTITGSSDKIIKIFSGLK